MSDLDNQIRDALLKEGDDGKTPRDTKFYFYGGESAGIERAALEECFAVRRMLEHDGLILEKTIAVDGVSFAPIGERMEAWAVEFGADYDGWECEVLVSD